MPNLKHPIEAVNNVKMVIVMCNGSSAIKVAS